jgi:hypothetical protein
MSKPNLRESQEGVSGAEMFGCGIDGIGRGIQRLTGEIATNAAVCVNRNRAAIGAIALGQWSPRFCR